MSQARVVQVILTDSLEGVGEGGSPYRRVAELWTLDGRLLATWDQYQGGGHRHRRSVRPREHGARVGASAVVVAGGRVSAGDVGCVVAHPQPPLGVLPPRHGGRYTAGP